jgi:GH15 family glucan-1,4-alpha-glucosidase
LKALTDAPTGGIVAAATTSLPEQTSNSLAGSTMGFASLNPSYEFAAGTSAAQ